jgi:aspartyl-tRNA synthetase
MGNVAGLMRTHHCGELRAKDEGSEVIVCGWMNKYRDLGGLHFIDLRDKHGITQLGFESFKGDLNQLKEFSLESVLWAKGKVRKRPDSAQNKNMPTGEVEVAVEEIKMLSYSDNIPFLPFGAIDSSEDLKLKYRYIDLRTNELQESLRRRSETAQKTRQTLYAEGFIEVETPILYKTTPEGARDYIVPSRVHPGKVYALPQSPQTLKQLLMIGGTDKYFQICKCFRDEDLRADRQPEFTQIDIEVSFATQDYIRNLATKLMKEIYSLEDSFEIPKMSYQDAMRDYGSDKPDLRFGLKHEIVNDCFEGVDFKVFSSVIKEGLIKAVFVPEDMGTLARKDIDALTEVVKPYGGKGVAWFKVTADGRSGGISKFISDDVYAKLTSNGNTGNGLWLFSADASHKVSHDCMDAVRRHLGRKLNLIKDGEYAFAWIYDFPLLEYDEDDKRFYALHHPFTSPVDEDKEKFANGSIEDLKNIRANAYDVVCNGYELGGGSVRIFENKIQQHMFDVLGFSKEDCERQFGFFIEALKYGTPPHAGIAFGLDRIMMILGKTEVIRDVIAFPKTNAATDLMASSPSQPNQDQLDELKMRFDK